MFQLCHTKASTARFFFFSYKLYHLPGRRERYDCKGRGQMGRDWEMSGIEMHDVNSMKSQQKVKLKNIHCQFWLEIRTKFQHCHRYIIYITTGFSVLMVTKSKYWSILTVKLFESQCADKCLKTNEFLEVPDKKLFYHNIKLWKQLCFLKE